MSTTKDKVSRSYDQIAGVYTEWVQSKTSKRSEYAAKVLSKLSADSNLLELGSGAGVPITETLVRHISRGTGSVTANDISTAQLALARKRCPSATFVPGDMMKLTFPEEKFDAVLSFFAIFHLPRAEHALMFERICTWLKPGGWLVCSLSAMDMVEKTGKFFGADMVWSSHGVEESKG